MKFCCNTSMTATISQPYHHHHSSISISTLSPHNHTNPTLTRPPKASASSSPSSSSSSQSTNKNPKKKIEEIRVCTERACRKQGSFDTLHVLSNISPPDVSVTSCGCLGKCGFGPNVVVLPQCVYVKYCGTPTKAADLMLFMLLGRDDEDECKRCLEALALRKRSEDEMKNGDFFQAQELLSQAIDLNPFGGVHFIYKDRCAARLAMGDVTKALEDAKAALALAPKYAEGYICQADALMAMEQIDAAQESYSIALELDPSLRRSKSFKARLAKLEEKFSQASSA